ncbi:MAG: Lrp/AsnC family transcriptional regulator [Promethearchaeota archaeon]
MALDKKDLAIIGALDRVGAKVSAEQLGEVLGIPSRTIRYRLSRLRKKGLLYPPRALIHERKIGLGESVICMKVTKLGAMHLPDIIDTLPSFYWMTESYGAYDGFMVQGVYPLELADNIPSLMSTFAKEGLVLDYQIFDIVDYEHKLANYEHLTADIRWDWDWKSWYKIIKRNLKHKSKFIIEMDESPQVIKFDSMDLALLKHLINNGESTQRQLAETLSMSETRAVKRLQRLETTGVIKGYKSTLIPTSNQFSHSLFLEIEEPVERVLSSLYELPFPLLIMMESRNRFCIQFRLNASDFTGFLMGFDLLRPHLSSYFFQTMHNPRRTSSPHPLELYNDEFERWEIPENSHDVIRDQIERG